MIPAFSIRPATPVEVRLALLVAPAEKRCHLKGTDWYIMVYDSPDAEGDYVVITASALATELRGMAEHLCPTIEETIQ